MPNQPHQRKQQPTGKKKSSSRGKRSARAGSHLGIRRIRGGAGWMFIHPRSVRDLSEDLEEVHDMIAAGEVDVAIDELRWLLENCHEMIIAHFLLGKLAVEADQDLPLARAHFGFGYHLGLKALRRAKMPTPIPVLHPANRPFYDAGRGLAWCLHALGKSPLALEIIAQLLKCDPSDPLGLAGWVDEINLGDKTLLQL